MEFLKEKNVQRLRDTRRLRDGSGKRMWKVASELEYLERCMHCSTDIPGSSPLTDMMSITKVVPRTISPFVQKRFLYRGLFKCSTNVMHL